MKKSEIKWIKYPEKMPEEKGCYLISGHGFFGIAVWDGKDFYENIIVQECNDELETFAPSALIRGPSGETIINCWGKIP